MDLKDFSARAFSHKIDFWDSVVSQNISFQKDYGFVLGICLVISCIQSQEQWLPGVMDTPTSRNNRENEDFSDFRKVKVNIY